MRKFTALLLTTILVLGLTVPTFANDYTEYNGNGYNYDAYNDYENGYNGYNGYNNDYTNMIPIAATSTGSAFGYIGDITQTNGYYEVRIVSGDDEVKVVVLVPTTDAVIVDSATGYPAALDDHNGHGVHVIYNPQTYKAYVVAINVQYTNAPNLHTIEAITWYGDTLQLTVDNGGLIVTLNEHTSLHSWLTRQTVSLDEFKVGDKVLLWYSIVGLSYPAQTIANRALRLTPTQQEIEYPYTADNNAYNYTRKYEDGYTYDSRQLTGNIVRAGVSLYAVRDNAYAAGYTVTWNNELRRAELIKDDILITLTPKYAVFYVDGTQHTMTAPSLIENGRLFAPASFFDKL